MPNKIICNPSVQEYLDKLKIRAASSKKFPSQKKTDSANHACLQNNPIDQEYMDKLKIPTVLGSNFHSAYHTCLNKQSVI